MKLRDFVQWLLFVIIVVLATYFAWEFFFRLNLEYNELGRYFDPDNAVVYEEQAISVFGLFLVVSIMMLVVVAYWMRRSSK